MKVAKLAFFGRKIVFVALSFQNELEYWNANRQLRSALNVATLCTNLVMFDAVTPEKRLLIFALLWKKNYKNGHVRPIISEHVWPISTYYSALVDMWVGIIYVTFVLRSLKGRCYGNQLIWGAFCKRQIWPLPVCGGVLKRNAVAPSA